MAEKTEIAWCDATFNPWIGCTKVSPGCDNCYAARQDGFRRWTPAGWGAGQPRKRTKTWGDPAKWNERPFYECRDCGWRGESESSGCPMCAAEIHTTRRRVFCASLADIWDNEVPIEWLVDFLDLCRLTPNLDKLILTKRIGNVEKRLREAKDSIDFDQRRSLWLFVKEWLNREDVPSHIWLGATIVNQEEADRDIPKLLATPARVRFLSMEPLLGPVDLTPHLWGRAKPCTDCPKDVDCGCGFYPRGAAVPDEPALHQVIVGGESGPNARPMHPDWARDLRDQCRLAGVPFLFKQWGEWASVFHARLDPAVAEGKPYVHVTPMCRLDGTNMSAPNYQLDRVGKKAAGRLLDGVTHDGYPVET